MLNIDLDSANPTRIQEFDTRQSAITPLELGSLEQGAHQALTLDSWLHEIRLTRYLVHLSHSTSPKALCRPRHLANLGTLSAHTFNNSTQLGSTQLNSLNLAQGLVQLGSPQLDMTLLTTTIFNRFYLNLTYSHSDNGL